MGNSGVTLDQRIFRGEPEALQTFIQQCMGRLALIAGFRMPVELHQYVKVHQVLQAAEASMIRRQAEFSAAGRRPGFLWLREVLLQAIKRLADRFLLIADETVNQLSRHCPMLSVVDREILFLRHYEELTNDEAAVVTGISPQAISLRYLQILQEVYRETARTEQSIQVFQETADACG